MTRLSPEERKTLEAYKIIAFDRNTTHGNPDFWRPEFEKFRGLLPQGLILDIGCGAGRDALLFEQEKYKYIGVDLSEDMLRQARIIAPTSIFLSMNMYNLGFAKHSFDGFWAAASLLHVPKNNIRDILAEIRRVVKSNGIGFISLKYGVEEKMVLESSGTERFFSFYTLNEFIFILVENGFDLLEFQQSRNYVWLTYLVKVL